MNLLTWLGGWLDTNLAIDPVLFNPFRSTVNAISQWINARLDMHLDFTGDLMTPDWSIDDGDPVLRPERKPDTRNIGAYYTPEPLATAIESGAFLTTIAQHVERLKGRAK